MGLGAAVEGEPVGATTILGAGVILAGVALAGAACETRTRGGDLARAGYEGPIDRVAAPARPARASRNRLARCGIQWVVAAQRGRLARDHGSAVMP